MNVPISTDKSITAKSTNLDLLRAIAVLCVFTSHLLEAVGVQNIGSLGRFGVVIFFVHTSFVLMASLQRLESSSASDRQLIQTFWLRRFFRIYPLAIVFVALAAICSIPPSPELTYHWIGIKGLLSNFTLTQNLFGSPNILDPLWSLPLEVQMYVLLPFLYFLIRGKNSFHSLAIWGLSILLAVAMPRLNWRLSVFLFGPCFVSGIVAFDLLRRFPQQARKLPSWVWPASIFAIIAAFGPRDNISLDKKIHLAWILSLVLGFLYVSVREGSVNFIQRVFHWIAEHSYGIYLSHTVLIWLAFYLMGDTPMWIRVLVLVVSMIVVPALLYRYIEHPLVLVGNRISRHLLHPTG